MLRIHLDPDHYEPETIMASARQDEVDEDGYNKVEGYESDNEEDKTIVVDDVNDNGEISEEEIRNKWYKTVEGLTGNCDSIYPKTDEQKEIDKKIESGKL